MSTHHIKTMVQCRFTKLTGDKLRQCGGRSAKDAEIPLCASHKKYAGNSCTEEKCPNYAAPLSNEETGEERPGFCWEHVNQTQIVPREDGSIVQTFTNPVSKGIWISVYLPEETYHNKSAKDFVPTEVFQRAMAFGAQKAHQARGYLKGWENIANDGERLKQIQDEVETWLENGEFPENPEAFEEQLNSYYASLFS